MHRTISVENPPFLALPSTWMLTSYDWKLEDTKLLKTSKQWRDEAIGIPRKDSKPRTRAQPRIDTMYTMYTYDVDTSLIFNRIIFMQQMKIQTYS